AIFNQSVYGIPEFIYNLGALPQNLLADATGQDWLRADWRSATEGTPLDIINRVVDYAKSSQEYHNSQIRYTEDDILNSLTNGKWAEAGSKIAGGIITTIPSMMSMYMTGGLSRAGQLSGVSKTAL